MVRLIAFCVCVSLATAAPAIAQVAAAPPATRAEELQRAREAKRQSATPYVPSALERGMRVAEERLAPLLVGRDGVHWKLGSLTSGSGFAYGMGYRHRRLFDREGAFNVWAAGSLKRYWAAEARFDMPSLAAGRLMLGVRARRHNYPQEDFFGLGPGSRRGDHTSFQMSNTIVGGLVGVKPAPRLTVGAGLEYSRPEVRRGRNTKVPTIDALFDDATAPGLIGERSFLRTSAFVDFDYRQPKNARRGGWYKVEASRVGDDTDAFTFNRVDIDLRQYASILGERRVLAVRLFASTSDPVGGARIPFYSMPSLGGHDSLRGFRDYRFRGPHAVLTQTEYRFEIWSGLDAALFYDAGKVAARRSDLNFTRLEDAYGFGFRFNTDNGAILRIDAGFGSRDGKHLYIVFGDVF
jgi:outer membrane protein assembly factor BamA